MNVSVRSVHIQGALCSGQRFHLQHLMCVPCPFFVVVVMPVLLSFVVMVSRFIVRPLPTLVIGMGREMNLAKNLLEMQVAVEIILKPQDPLAFLIRTKNEKGPCRPPPLIEESKSPILVKPDLAGILAPQTQRPLARKLLVKGSAMIGMEHQNILPIGLAHHVEREQEEDHQHGRNKGSNHAANIHHARGLILQFLPSV